MKQKLYGVDFKHLEVNGYRNINEIYLQKNQLHACETLFGDWNAKLMILAQDAANFKTIELLLKANPNKNPFRHGENVDTNQNLFNLLDEFNFFKLGKINKPNNKNCGIYYANAVWLLKISDSMSGRLVDKKKAFLTSEQVFKATLDNLDNLKLIITLGHEPFLFLKTIFNKEIIGNWHDTVIKRKLNYFKYKDKNLIVGSIYHTSKRGIIGRAKKNKYTGKGSFEKGYQLCLEDLKEIINKSRILTSPLDKS